MLIELAENRWMPDALIRQGIRRLLARRLREEQSRASAGKGEAFLAEALPRKPMTVHVDAANQQHYEVPARFFQLVLGNHLKYSCGLWPSSDIDLSASEAAMLELTCQRAELADGQNILELGCGWGSLTLWMAEHFPNAQILAVSNSHGQREYILNRAKERGLNRIEVVTSDIADFDPERAETRGPFDRVVSVEMFEHVRNHSLLFERIANWLTSDGQLFVHIFCHESLTYLFQPEGKADWMARHFFTGGMMPSRTWLNRFDRHLQVAEQWAINGTHYQRTSEAWLDRLDRHHEELQRLFEHDLSPRLARQQLQRWRMFFMACAELFGYRQGNEWFVEHYRLQRAGDSHA